MSESDLPPSPGVPGGGNLWDSDHNSEGFRYLSQVSAQFAFYLKEYFLWLTSDPTAGRTASVQVKIGKHLEFVGRAMQAQGLQRIEVMHDFGSEILQRLAALEADERLSVYEIAGESTGTFVRLIELACQDLARSGAVDEVRAKPGRIGVPAAPTTYAITTVGRALLMDEVPALPTTSGETAVGGGSDV